MLKLLNLTTEVRKLMLLELQADKTSNTYYKCPRLTPNGERDWLQLLEEAIVNHNDMWLANELLRNGRLKIREISHRNGKQYEKDVPYNANITLAEGEFNKYYIRGLCLHAISQNIDFLTIYRAKEVLNARSESYNKIGQQIKADLLLDDLRKSNGLDTSLGLPSGPNSGLSARL